MRLFAPLRSPLAGSLSAFTLAVTFACLTAAAPAFADDAREQSRTAFRKGVTAAKENNYVGARDAFAEAYRLFPHPSILLNLGIARGKSGQLVDAEQDLMKFLADDGGASQDEIRSARQMLSDVRDKLGTLSLQVKTAGAKASLDGKPIALVSGQVTPVRAAAGQHKLLVEAEGYEPSEQTVDIVSKIETPLAVDLVAKPGMGGDGAPVVTTSGVSPKTIGFVLVGTGVALAGAGTFFGLRSLSLRSEWNEFTAEEQLDPDNAGIKTRGKLYRTITDVLFLGAIVSAGAGAYFLFVKSSAPNKPSAGFLLGPSFSGITGSF